MIPPDRVYADPGDRLAGRYDPPRLCVVVTQWRPGGGPRNVAVRYLDNGATAVIPFARRLRRVRDGGRMAWKPGDRVEVFLPVKGRNGRFRFGGTVREVDPPGLPPGVRVDLDETVNGVQNCFATHAELRALAG